MFWWPARSIPPPADLSPWAPSLSLAATSAGCLQGRSWPEVGGSESAGGRELLVPVGVDDGRDGKLVQLLELGGSESPAYSPEVVNELLFGAGANDDRADAGAARQPVQGHLRWRNLMRLGDCAHRFNDVKCTLHIE